MPKNISKELEREILSLPLKEKDKMLLRLISKKQLLVDQLTYKLLENEEIYLRERRDALRETIQQTASSSFHNNQELFNAIKALFTAITYHRKATLDKYGEAELTVFMFVAFFRGQPKFLTQHQFSRYNEKMALFLVKKTIAVITAIEKLHEDYRIEFTAGLEELSLHLYDGITRLYAQQLNVPKLY